MSLEKYHINNKKAYLVELHSEVEAEEARPMM